MVEFDARETTVAPLRLRQGNDHGLRQRVRGLGGAFRAIRAREQAVITRDQTCAQSSEVVRAPPRTRASAVAVTLAASMRSCRPVIRVDVGVDVAVGRVVVMVNVVVKMREVTSEKSLTAMLLLGIRWYDHAPSRRSEIIAEAAAGWLHGIHIHSSLREHARARARYK